LANDVLVQPDGKVVAAGATRTSTSKTGADFLVARYNADGTLDGGFGTGGRTITDIGRESNSVNAVTLQPGTDGKILVAGQTGDVGGDFALARYTANGTLDTTFGKRGITLTNMAGEPGDYADSIAVQSDGKIVVAGLANTAPSGITYYFALARYTANGALDTTFGSGGKVITSIRASGGNASFTHSVALALQGDGKIVLAGGTYPQPNGDFVVARFNLNGTPDAAFGSGGQVLTDFAGGEDRVSEIALQTDGKIVAVGNTTVSGSYQWLAAARYNPDGTLDIGFGQGGTVTTPVGTGLEADANDVAIQSDGKILAGGYALNGDPDYLSMVLVRYNADGSLDTTYGQAGTGVVLTLIGTYARAAALALQPDGKAVLAGNATVNGVDALALTRYTASAEAPSAVRIGSFAASSSIVAAGSPVTQTASGITTTDTEATVPKVALSHADSSSTEQFLGHGTHNADGTGTPRFPVNRAPASYTLLALAVDSAGADSDPFAPALAVV
jgi:uncharacterized delta-60 repeat protein